MTLIVDSMDYHVASSSIKGILYNMKRLSYYNEYKSYYGLP